MLCARWTPLSRTTRTGSRGSTCRGLARTWWALKVGSRFVTGIWSIGGTLRRKWRVCLDCPPSNRRKCFLRCIPSRARARRSLCCALRGRGKGWGRIGPRPTTHLRKCWTAALCSCWSLCGCQSGQQGQWRGCLTLE